MAAQPGDEPEFWKIHVHFLQPGVSREEALRHREADRKRWPVWLQIQFNRYIQLLAALQGFCVSGENADDIQNVLKVIGDLQQPIGIMYDFGNRFSIGGPGAHPHDVLAVSHDHSLDELLQESRTPTALVLSNALDEYSQSLIKEYSDGEWLNYRRLSATTASARSRSLARGVEAKLEYYQTSYTTGVPQVLRVEATAGGDPGPLVKYGRELWFDEDIFKEAVSKAEAKAGLRELEIEDLDPKNAKEKFMQGGYHGLSGKKGHWVSLPEVMHHLRVVRYWHATTGHFKDVAGPNGWKDVDRAVRQQTGL